MVDALAAEGVRVLTFDTFATDPADVAAAALAVLDHLGLRVVHVVAMRSAIHAARRLSADAPSRVASLLLIAPAIATTSSAPGVAARAALRAAAASSASARPRRTPRTSSASPPQAGLDGPPPPRVRRARLVEPLVAILNLLGRPSDAPDDPVLLDRVAALCAHGADPVAAFLADPQALDGPPLSGSWLGPATVLVSSDDPTYDGGVAAALAADVGGRVVADTGEGLGVFAPWGAEARIAALVADAASRQREMVRRPRGVVAVRQRPRSAAGMATTIVATVVLLVGSTLFGAARFSVPYYEISPGTARQVNDLVRVPSARLVAPKGRILFVTVGVKALTALEYPLATVDSDVDVVPEAAILGDTSKKDYAKVTAVEMSSSKQAAAVVALRRLGYEVTERGKGAFLQSVQDNAPAAIAGLKQGDVITGIAGAPITLAGQLLTKLRTSKPGDALALTVQGPGDHVASRSVTLVLGSRTDDPAKPYAGVTALTQAQDFDFPFPVDIELGRVGGPSAGLAFTLAILDELTPGELTGGVPIATTGTIELDGSVGQVGGVPQKAIAVSRSAARLFLVPSAELKEARRRVGPNVKVVPVDTLEQALQALRDNGGDVSGIPPPPR